MENQVVTTTQTNDVFAQNNFEHAQRTAKALASSNLVPQQYQNNVANCLIALDMSMRIGASPLMVMQHLYIVKGKPSWSSSFLIATINKSGKFKTALKFKVGTKGGCVAYATDHDGEILESPEITLEMAKAEGWSTKDGSKWKTMPDLMIRYRAAAFFSRLYCPELTMGMQTFEELEDITGKASIINATIKTEEELERERIEFLIDGCTTLKQLHEMQEMNPDVSWDLYETKIVELKTKING